MPPESPETETGAFFSYGLVQLRHARAKRIARADSGFLVEHAAREICDRIAVTNRTFTRVLDLFSPTNAMSDAISALLPQATIVRLCEGIGTSRNNMELEPESFDLVVSAFGLHWCNDLPGTLIQARLAMRPDGLLLAALPAEGTLSQLREAMIGAETALSGGAALRVDPFIEIRQAGALLQRTGYALPVADSETLKLRYPNTSALISELRAMGATTSLAGKRPRLSRRFPQLLEQEYRDRFADADGRIPATVNLVYFTGWSPHESQQKPLMPGSAIASLKDALKLP